MDHRAAGGVGREKQINVSVGSGCTLSGKINLEGQAHLDCKVKGEIISRGELTIGQSADIEASLQGEIVKIFGRVRGDITCSHCLELHEGANVMGNIITPGLVIREGVVFEGHCSMKKIEGLGSEIGLQGEIAKSSLKPETSGENASSEAYSGDQSQSGPVSGGNPKGSYQENLV